MNAPCKGCEERELGCHSKCERYIAFHEFREDIRRKKEAERLLGKYKREQVSNRIRGEQ